MLTKADGDARGGAALSVRQVTGKPILFVGVGEKTDALEVFHPERIASRILGMGDVRLADRAGAATRRPGEGGKLAAKLTKGKGFDFTDLREQLAEFNRMGGVAGARSKLPNQALPPGRWRQVDERSIRRQIGIIDAMTPGERRRPGDHCRFPQAPDRRRGGGPGPGSEPPPQAIHADGKSHEEDAGRRARQDDAEASRARMAAGFRRSPAEGTATSQPQRRGAHAVRSESPTPATKPFIRRLLRR